MTEEDNTLPNTPEIFLASDVNNIEDATVLPDTDEKKAKQLPDPSGYRILCAIPEAEEKTAGGTVMFNVYYFCILVAYQCDLII